MAGVRQRSTASGKEKMYKYEGSPLEVPSCQEQVNASFFEDQLAKLRPH